MGLGQGIDSQTLFFLYHIVHKKRTIVHKKRTTLIKEKQKEGTKKDEHTTNTQKTNTNTQNNTKHTIPTIPTKTDNNNTRIHRNTTTIPSIPKQRCPKMLRSLQKHSPQLWVHY